MSKLKIMWWIWNNLNIEYFYMSYTTLWKLYFENQRRKSMFINHDDKRLQEELDVENMFIGGAIARLEQRQEYE